MKRRRVQQEEDASDTDSSDLSSETERRAVEKNDVPRRGAMCSFMIAVGVLCVAGSAATLITTLLHRHGIALPPALHIAEGNGQRGSFQAIFDRADLQFKPFIFSSESKKVGAFLKSVCLSEGAGVISLRHLDESSRVETYLFDDRKHPIVTDINTKVLDDVNPDNILCGGTPVSDPSIEIRDLSVRSVCIVLFLPTLKRTHPFFDLVLPLLREDWGPASVCQGLFAETNPFIVLVTPTAIPWLDHASDKLLKAFFDTDTHLRLPTVYKTLHQKWVCSDTVYVIEPDSLQHETERSYDLPSAEQREELWARLRAEVVVPPRKAGFVIATAGIASDWDAVTKEAQMIGFYPITFVKGRLPFRELRLYNMAMNAAVILASLPALAGVAYFSPNTTNILCVTNELTSLKARDHEESGRNESVDASLTRHMLRFYGFSNYTVLQEEEPQRGENGVVISADKIIAELARIWGHREERGE